MGTNIVCHKMKKRVVDLWDKECHKVDGHYEIPIPWRPDLQLPDYLVMAMSRLKSLKGKRGLTFVYDGEMKKLLENAFAELVPDNSRPVSGHVWYLAHQVVITDKQPGKVHIVFDCAAKFQGVSLNSSYFKKSLE